MAASVERKTTRERRLSAARFDIATFEALWNKILQSFPRPGDVSADLTCEFKGETFTFKDLASLKNYPDLPATLKDFRLYFSQDGQRLYISIYGPDWVVLDSKVEATGPSEVWCTGAVEAVAVWVKRHRSWTHWLHVVPLGWLAALTSSLGALVLPRLLKDYMSEPQALQLWAVLSVIFVSLFVIRSALVPYWSLRLRGETSFVKRYAVELGLIGTFLGVVIPIVLWFFTRHP